MPFIRQFAHRCKSRVSCSGDGSVARLPACARLLGCACSREVGVERVRLRASSPIGFAILNKLQPRFDCPAPLSSVLMLA